MKQPSIFKPKRRFGPFSYYVSTFPIYTGNILSRAVYFTDKSKKHSFILKWEKFQPNGKPARVIVNYDTNPCADISPL